MVWKVSHSIILLILLMLSILYSSRLSANDYLQESLYEWSEQNESNFNKNTWHALLKDINLTPQDTLQKQTKKNTQNLKSEDNAYSKLYVFSIGLFLAIIAISVFLFMQQKNNKSINTTLKNYKEEVEDIHTFNAKDALQASLKAKDYQQSIRHNFLEILKKLSQLNYITWSKDKASIIYIFELQKNAPHYVDSFKEVAQIFDFVWYSDRTFTDEEYAIAAPYFSNFLATIK